MRSSSRLFHVLRVVIVLALLAGILGVGIVIGSLPGVGDSVRAVLPGGVSSEVSFSLEQEVLADLRNDYYIKISPGSLEEDALRGMLSALNDPYTVYFSPAEYARFKQMSAGRYSGIGMTVGMKSGFVVVVSTFKGSPAEAGGIKAGDIILAVNGVSTRSLNLDDVVARIQGAEGSPVKVRIYQPPPTAASVGGETTKQTAQLPAGGTTKEPTIKRRSIDIPVVEATILKAGADKVAYIRFFTFSQGAAEKLRAAVETAIKQEQASAIILDLRENGGGLLNEAIGVSSIFLPKNSVVVTTEGLHSPKAIDRTGGGPVTNLPLYVLTDRFSASASEIVAGSLKDHNRALLVGETTFGKALVQTVEKLSNGGALKLTTARYLTPKGSDINKKGIEPNAKAPDNPATPKVDETLAKALDLIAH